MNRAHVWVLAAAVWAAASACAAVQREGAAASPFGPGTGEPVRAQRVTNTTLFAPASVANTRRMTVQQRDEWRFLKDASANARFETDASRLALGRSSHAGVRNFAATLINHHTAAGNELVHMLHVRGMAPPMLSTDQRKALNRLAKLHGARFDREYLDEVGLKNQQEDVQAFEKARLNTRDPQLRAWIDRMLPTLRYHLGTVERLAPADSRHARGAGAASAAPSWVAPEAEAQPLTVDPFVARASMATRAMGAGRAPEVVLRPLLTQASESSSR